LGFDRTIEETEKAYKKILESSRTLLKVLKREASRTLKGIEKDDEKHERQREKMSKDFYKPS